MLIRADATRLLVNEFIEMKNIYNMDVTGLNLDEVPGYFYQCEFVPQIIKSLDKDNKKNLYKIFAFLEKLLIEGNNDIKDIVISSVIEAIYHDYDFKKYKEAVFSLCGPLTRKSFDNLNYDESVDSAEVI